LKKLKKRQRVLWRFRLVRGPIRRLIEVAIGRTIAKHSVR
jgi:hypothetical protein